MNEKNDEKEAMKICTENAGRRVALCLTAAGLVACASTSQPEPVAVAAAASPPAVGEGRSSTPAAAPGSDETADAPRATAAEPVIVEGSGRFVGYPAAPGSLRRDDAGVAVELRDADVREVIRSVASDTLGQPVLIDERVQGEMSFDTGGKVSRAELLPLLEQALLAQGIAMVRRNGTLQFVPVEALDQGPLALPLVERGATAGAGVQVLPLRYAEAEALRQAIEPLLPAGSLIEAERDRNALVVTGSGPARAAAAELVRMFDVDWLAGMSYGLLPLSAAPAEEVAAELEAVFTPEQGAETRSLARFLPIARLNAVLVISRRPELVARAGEWVERLDRGGSEAARSLHVYRVQHGRARDLAAVVGGIFGATPQPLGIGDDRPATTAPAGGAFRQRAGTDEAGPERGPLAGSIRDLLPRADTSPVAFGNERLRIIADEQNNALVIFAPPEDYRAILTSLRQLDLPPLQVVVEATIAEVTLNDELRYGVQWFFRDGNDDFTLSDAASGAVQGRFPGFAYSYVSADGDTFVLDALEAVTDVEVVSSPQLMVLNNQTAVLQVGDEVPVVTRQAQSVIDPDAPIVNSIEFRNTGVILRVTPRVNAGGLVLMEVEQEVSEVVQTTTSGIDSPTIRQRRILSNVAVDSGQTVALGGLIRDRQSDGERGVPVLSRVPVVGNLFKTTEQQTERTELVVLITPRVAADGGQARQLTEELRKRLASLRALEARVGLP